MKSKISQQEWERRSMRDEEIHKRIAKICRESSTSPITGARDRAVGRLFKILDVLWSAK